MLVLAVLLFVLAVAAAVIGAAGLTGRLPRNDWVGVRTVETANDDDAFRLANRVAGPSLLGAGLLLGIGAAAAIALTGPLAVVAAVGTAIVAIATAGAGATLGARAAATHTPVTGGCGNACVSCSLRGSGCESSP